MSEPWFAWLNDYQDCSYAQAWGPLQRLQVLQGLQRVATRLGARSLLSLHSGHFPITPFIVVLYFKIWSWKRISIYTEGVLFGWLLCIFFEAKFNTALTRDYWLTIWVWEVISRPFPFRSLSEQEFGITKNRQRSPRKAILTVRL